MFPPKIVENKLISYEGDLLIYQVKAIDPDGGTLTYSLKDAPKDMVIDSQTGYYQMACHRQRAIQTTY